jgi:hypothetical protein
LLFIQLKNPANADAKIHLLHVAKANNTEKIATTIVKRCTSGHSGQVIFDFNSSNDSDM